MSEHQFEEQDDMPIVETYRGVGIHDFQPAERIEAVIKPAIDTVYGLTDGSALETYALDATNPPEARLFAAARIEAMWQIAAENREVRPRTKPDLARVSTGMLDSLNWASPWHYGSLLEPGPAPGERRSTRDPACLQRLEQAQAAWSERDRQRRSATAPA